MKKIFTNLAPSYIALDSLTFSVKKSNSGPPVSSYARCASLQIEIQLHVKKQTDNVAKVKSHKQKLIVSAD